MTPLPVPLPHPLPLASRRLPFTHHRRWLTALLLLGTTLLLRAADSTNAPVLQPWDYADQLDLTAAQRNSLQEIQARYETARAAVRRHAASNTPPDLRLAAQLDLNAQVRIANRQIGELLTEIQKGKLGELRGRLRTPGSTPDNTNAPPAPAAATANRDTETDAVPTLPTRKPARPRLQPDQYESLAAQLRAAYALPPSQWPQPHLDDEVKPYYRELGLLPPVDFPSDNPYSDAKAELGKQLFFEPRLSGSGQISCASCHDPDLAFADGRTVSFGHQRKELTRNAPTVANAAFNSTFFWDGRAGSLEQQAMDVVNNPDEMHANADLVTANLGSIPEYTNAFHKVFGSPEVTLPRAAQAIATFERTLTSRGNDFDSFLRGDTNALANDALRGLHLFRTTARCINCHHGPNFTDGRFHNEGLTYYGRKYEDLGRYRVTQVPSDIGRFKTPTLRNITRTAPYMHNGLFELDGVLNMYNAGMPNPRRRPDQTHDPLFPTKSPLLQPLGLNTQDIADLKAFLQALTETRFRLRPPRFSQSTPDTSAH